jgi:hypothetical protein
VPHGVRRVVRFEHFLVRLLHANRWYNRPFPRALDGVSSLVPSFEPLEPFVLLPHEGHDDYREQDDKGHHNEQLQHRIHAATVTKSGASIAGIRQHKA